MGVPVANRQKLLGALAFAAAVFLPAAWLGGLVAARELPRGYGWAWSLAAGLTAFAIAYTGRVSKWRRLFFALSALAFLFHFKSGLFFKGFEPSCFKDTPYCHIALAPSFLNYLYQQYLALFSPGWKLWGPLALGAAWLFVTLALGRAWCSWACFYGGIDDGLSALARRPLLNLGGFALRLRDLPAALLVFFLLISFAEQLPAYCTWLCPFKFTGAFLDAEPGPRRLQYGLMFLSIGVLTAGPLLTKKRTFCSYLCPFAAWQAFWGRLNPYRLTTDEKACVKCGACTKACPSLAFSTPEGGCPKAGGYCNLCGECLAACPSGALRYTVFGLSLPAAAAPWLTVEKVLVFSSLLTASVFSSLWGPAALRDFVQLISR